MIDEVKTSGLRGRGGAGFPTGIKWGFLPNNIWPHYVVANADESEPGTFKDREIMEGNPFQFLEGAGHRLPTPSRPTRLTSTCAASSGSWPTSWTSSIAELEKAGLLGDNLFGTDYSLRIYTHLGAGAYICGEETALLESLEGKLGQPRLRPPFPAIVRPVRQADRDQQCRNAGQRAADHRERRGLVQDHGHREEPGRQDLLAFRARQAARQLRAAAGHHLPRADLRPTAAASSTTARSRPSCPPALPPP